MNLVQRVTNLNKTHDYHNSALNLHSAQLKLFSNEDDQKSSNLGTRNPLRSRHEISLGNFRHAMKPSSNSRSSTRYAPKFETQPNPIPMDKSITKYVETINLYNIEASSEEKKENKNSAKKRKYQPAVLNLDLAKIQDNEEVKLFTDDEFDEDEFYIRPDEEVMITPSTESKHMSRIYQEALNQQSDSVEKPLKRVSKLSKV